MGFDLCSRESNALLTFHILLFQKTADQLLEKHIPQKLEAVILAAGGHSACPTGFRKETKLVLCVDLALPPDRETLIRES